MIVSRFFGVCFSGVSHNYRAIFVAKWGIAQTCLHETKYQEWVSHHFGAVLTPLKRIARYGVSQR